MHVLVTNDDGIYAPGLRALARVAGRLGRVSVVAPEGEQSGVAHSITLTQPLRVREMRREGKLFGRAVNGAPADCVRIAVKEVLSEPPDLVLSGINLGSNAGLNAFYSGTVAAALEGGLLGVFSVAVSLVYSPKPDFDLAAELAVGVIESLLKLDYPLPPVLSVNIPAVPLDRVKGARITHQGLHCNDEGYERRTDPRGEHYYWLRPDSQGARTEPGDDLKALRDGYIAITPLRFDLTDHSLYDRLRRVFQSPGIPPLSERECCP